MSGDSPQPPALRVVRGQPTPQELAALVAVLACASTPEPVQTTTPSTGRLAWSSPARAMTRAPGETHRVNPAWLRAAGM